MSSVVTATEESIRSRTLFRDGQSILVALSGGLDSTVLLDVLHRLSMRHRWKIFAAHFNHSLRGIASDGDEQFAKRLCEKLQIPFALGAGDVRGYAKEKGLSIEMAARDLRHCFLAQVARERGIQAIATAHHLDDQVELFLLRLLRGAGGGLAGMKWINPSPANSKIRLVRPFLNQSKAALLEHARSQGIKFRRDASNRSNDILRNRVRNQILPALLKFQPTFIASALRSMEIIANDNDFAKQSAEFWLAHKQRKSFEALHPAVQRQVVQAQLITLGIRPTYELIETLRSQSRRVVTVRSNFRVYRDVRGRLRKAADGSREFGMEELRLSLRKLAGETRFQGLNLCWERRRGGRLDLQFGSEVGCEWFDADRVGDAIILRHWRAGDRFHPIGMFNPVKLQDFFTNQKISSEKRHQLVVAATTQGQIFWIEGARIGEHFKLNPETRRVLRLRWSRQSEVAVKVRQ